MRKLKYPTSFQSFELTEHLTNAEFEKIKQGLEPAHMDSKWIIHFEESWAYFHRFQTGNCIFKIHLVNTDTGYLIDRLMINADADQYKLYPETAVQDFLEILQMFLDGIFNKI